MGGPQQLGPPGPQRPEPLGPQRLGPQQRGLLGPQQLGPLGPQQLGPQRHLLLLLLLHSLGPQQLGPLAQQPQQLLLLPLLLAVKNVSLKSTLCKGKELSNDTI